MLLNGEEIIARGLIHNHANGSVRAASYDVRIGTILVKRRGRTISTNSYELPPQGMVEVVSIERVALPENVAGFATVKTGLSNDCVLALGIGLIDPTFNNHVASTLVNFGTQPFRLEQNDPFLRLTFHEYPESTDVPQVTNVNFQTYLRDKRTKVTEKFSETFLNLPHTVQRAIRPLVWRLVGWAAVAALVVAIATAAASIGITMLGARLLPASTESQQLIDLRTKEWQDLQRQLAEEKAKVQTLTEDERQLQSELASIRKRLPRK